MQHYFPNVPKLGNVAVSRHAQQRATELGISEEEFKRTLLEPTEKDVAESANVVWRQRAGVRLVILRKPEPFRGAMLVKTIIKVQAQATPFRP